MLYTRCLEGAGALAVVVLEVHVIDKEHSGKDKRLVVVGDASIKVTAYRTEDIALNTRWGLPST